MSSKWNEVWMLRPWTTLADKDNSSWNWLKSLVVYKETLLLLRDDSQTSKQVLENSIFMIK